MPKTFHCPTCAAPLAFEGKMLVDCAFCGGTIIAPADIPSKEDLVQKRKLKAVNSIVKAFFSNANVESKGEAFVIDLRSSSKKAQQNLSSAVSEIRQGHTSNALNVFTQTFGVGSGEAAKIVDAIGHGKGFDASSLRIYPEVPRNPEYWNVAKLIGIGLMLILAVPVAFFLLVFVIALLSR